MNSLPSHCHVEERTVMLDLPPGRKAVSLHNDLTRAFPFARAQEKDRQR
jgi:hypothetical protein